MKVKNLSYLLLLCSFSCFAQSYKLPEFPGGAKKMALFIEENTQYPDEALKNNIQGKVYARFTVDSSGKLSGFEVFKGIGYGLDEEAIRMLKSMPDWNPAIVKGKKVSHVVNLPIKYIIEESDVSVKGDKAMLPNDSVDIDTQMKLIEVAEKKCLQTKSIIPLDELKNSGKIADSTNYTEMMLTRAEVLVKISPEVGDSLAPEVKKDILDSYEEAIEYCKRCELITRLRRYEYLKISDKKSQLYNEDLSILKTAGYKPDKEGFGLGLSYNRGKHNWIGGKFSLFALQTRIYEMTQLNPQTKERETVSKEWYTISLDAVSLNYAYNIDNSAQEFYIDLLKMNTPFNISISQFGFQKLPGKPGVHWFYRPELGLGYGIISVAYSYNFIFDKEIRPLTETHLLTLRLNLTFHQNKWF